MKKGHRGRPRVAAAKRRATTRAGRAARPDLGTIELRLLRQRLNGRDDLPTDPLGALLARELISAGQHAQARRYAFLTSRARALWGLSEASVADLYRRMIAGTISDIATKHLEPGAPGENAAAERELTAMNHELWPPGDDGSGYHMVRAVVLDSAWPSWLKRRILREPQRPRDDARLAILCAALERLVAMSRPRNGHKLLDVEQFCA
jgi:hypothetical protein